jgi:hypothetical protein
MDHFDREKWKEIIKRPDWYNEVVPTIIEALKYRETDYPRYKKGRDEIYDFFMEEAARGNVVIGETGKDFDEERKPIDIIVIHHTSKEPGLSAEELSTMEMVRLYAPYYFNPTYEDDKELKGKPIFSGHFREGKQVFWPYHWIVRSDGSAERLLNDNETGWHCGNWDVNCRSVAIVLDNDYENGKPSEKELAGIARIIKENYSFVDKENIIGHLEVNSSTTCPSKLFLGENGWKKDLLELI